MLTKRIIPCLDVLDGNVVKGIKFRIQKYRGNPVERAREYYEQGADELVFLDIGASPESSEIMLDVVEKVAEQIFIPFTVGGGIRNLEDIRKILSAGADKVSINTAAVKKPELIREASEKFGSQCIVVAIDARRKGNSWEVLINGGRTPAGKDAVEWAKEVEKLGAGELLLTSFDADGTKSGYDLELTQTISETLNIPIIASGGAGTLESIYEVLQVADAALAASIFHYNEYTVQDVKNYLKSKGVVIR